MSLGFFLTLLFWGLTAFNVIFVLRDLLRFDLRLEIDEAPGPDNPLVTVVVPMRNEVDNVERCLAAVRAQSYPELDVIVVDDGSTDGTTRKLAELQRDWPALRVVSVAGPPPGWAGKTHAVHRGVQEARGEWLLFIDADVVLGEHAVATVVRTAQRRNWPILSLHGRMTYDTFWERTLQLPVAILTHGYQVMMPGTVLNGQFILIRRGIYESIGGFASVPDAVVEDAALAHRLVEHGHRPRVRVWPDAYRCRMYTSGGVMWEGFTRMLAGYNGFQPAPLIIVALLYSTVLVPQLLLVGLLISGLLGGPTSVALAAATGSLVAVQVGCSLIIAHRLGAPLTAGLLKPIADLNVTAVLLDSARRAAFGGVTWKGRRYAGSSPVEESSPVSTPAPPAPIAALQLSVVVPLSSESADGTMPSDDGLHRAADLARRHPNIEVIGVHRGEAPADIPSLANLRLISTEVESFWEQRRVGVEAARAHVVAVSDATADDPTTWIETILAAFDDPTIQLVTGPTRYDCTSAAAIAASVREWGHLTDPWTVYPSQENFAGRRDILLRVLPTGTVTRAEGGILLGALASLDGTTCRVIREATATVPIRNRDDGSISRSMAARLTAATSLAMMAWLRQGRQPLLTLFWIRLMPLTVSGDTLLLTLRILWNWFDRFEVPGIRRPAVVLWLHLLAVLDLLLALRVIVTWRQRSRNGPPDAGSDDRMAWQNRILGIVRRMLVNPRHRPVSGPQ